MVGHERVLRPAPYGAYDALQPEVRLDLDQQNGPARVWAAQEPIQREIRHLFRTFLREFAHPDSGELVYKQRMRDMCTSALPAPAAAALSACLFRARTCCADSSDISTASAGRGVNVSQPFRSKIKRVGVICALWSRRSACVVPALLQKAAPPSNT